MAGKAPGMESEPLTERIKTYRNEYTKQRAVMKKIENERVGDWDMSMPQLEELMKELQDEISEVKMDFCFDNLQEILERVTQEKQNIVEDPFCLCFYDNKGKLWQLKECTSVDKDTNKYKIDTEMSIAK